MMTFSHNSIHIITLIEVVFSELGGDLDKHKFGFDILGCPNLTVTWESPMSRCMSGFASHRCLHVFAAAGRTRLEALELVSPTLCEMCTICSEEVAACSTLLLGVSAW